MHSSPKPNVMLRGGPDNLVAEMRLQHAANVTEKLKILNGNGYEHYLPTAETVQLEGLELTVFEWSTRTRVAE
jgi:hypothetical protein